MELEEKMFLRFTDLQKDKRSDSKVQTHTLTNFHGILVNLNFDFD